MSMADILRSTGYTIGRRVRVTGPARRRGLTGTVIGAVLEGDDAYLTIQLDGHERELRVQPDYLAPESGIVRAAP